MCYHLRNCICFTSFDDNAIVYTTPLEGYMKPHATTRNTLVQESHLENKDSVDIIVDDGVTLHDDLSDSEYNYDDDKMTRIVVLNQHHIDTLVKIYHH